MLHSWLRDRWSVAAVIVLLASGILFFSRLGDRAVVSEELRWAEIAREMRQTGDYLHPTINGRPYPDKPAGSYWLIVAASYLTDGVTETSARLPAAFAGWLGVLLVLVLGRRLYDLRAGVMAAAVLGTGFGFAFYARRATADMETVTGVLAAVTLYAHRREQSAGPWVVLLWVIMAATSLTKGLLGVVLPVVILGTDATWTGLLDSAGIPGNRGRLIAVVRANRWFFNPWTVVAVPLAIAIYLAPFVFASSEATSAGLQMVWRENIRRFVSPHNHTGPIYLYVGVLPLLAAPWSVFLPAALWRPTPSGRTSGDRLARAFFWAVFLFFTLSASRRSYYLLPIMPAVALLIGRVLTSGDELAPVARRLRSLGYGVICGAIVLAGVVLLDPVMVLPSPYDTVPPLPARGLIALGWVVGLVGIVWALRRLTSRGPVLAAGAAWSGVGLTLLVGLTMTEDFRTRRAFAAEVRAHVSDPAQLGLYHARDLVFDLASPEPVPEYQTPEELLAGIEGHRVHWLVVRRRYLAGLSLDGVTVAAEPGRPWDGLDQAGDKMILLELPTTPSRGASPSPLPGGSSPSPRSRAGDR